MATVRGFDPRNKQHLAAAAVLLQGDGQAQLYCPEPAKQQDNEEGQGYLPAEVERVMSTSEAHRLLSRVFQPPLRGVTKEEEAESELEGRGDQALDLLPPVVLQGLVLGKLAQAYLDEHHARLVE